MPQVLREDFSAIFDSLGLQISSVVDLSFLRLEPDLAQYETWLKEGGHAEMKFMEENKEARENYEKILPGVKTALVFAVPYATGLKTRQGNSSQTKKSYSEPPISSILYSTARYARGKDYHKTIRKQLEAAALQLKVLLNMETRAVVDTVPFLERAHGRVGGLGFVGKNTMLIRPGVGSYFFIATLFSTANASDFLSSKIHNPFESLNCGSCTKCLDACPTQALSSPYFLDAKRCLSYLTIENRDLIPDAYVSNLKETFYGCDICQQVCPYNLSTLDLRTIPELAEPHNPLLTVTAEMVARMSEIQYEQWFGGTAMIRAKYSGLVRNALYHLWAKGDEALQRVLEERKRDKNSLIRRTVEHICKIQNQTL